MIERNTYGEIEVGDAIGTYVDREAPSNAYGNGRLWSGTVTAVEDLGDKVRITVDVEGRSLCADDLVYGFGATREGGFRPVVYDLTHDKSEYVQRRVRDARTGRRYWSGIKAFGA